VEPDHQGPKAARVTARVRALLGRLWRARPQPEAPQAPPPPTLAEELAAAGVVGNWAASRRAERRLYSSLSEAQLERLKVAEADRVRDTVAAAERLLGHEFDLLGSGPFVPRDPGRAASGAYQPIDWYLDPVQKLRFPERVPIDKWNLLEMRPGLADVKFPWELSRCQHWLPLAQAFRLTGELRYATEILDQHDDFMAANPVGLGVNWTCTMDVALRALNWALAVELIHADPRIDEPRLGVVYASLFDHGHFIERHLENKYEVTSNHFLSNVVGLFGLAVFFGALPSAQRWRASGRTWLEQEMTVQVLDDGADYESSVPYHRLVAELFMSGARLADVDGATLSPDYRRRLRDMINFHWSVLRPDGKLPQIGDADDGRVHLLSGYGTWNPQDARHLLAPAAAMFDEPKWRSHDDPWAAWEAIWWGYEAPVPPRPARNDVSRLFPSAGIAVIRNERDYLVITNGVVGTNGFGNHKHNDLLSFEFHQSGTPLVVDAGSFVYTSNPDARNYFRGTAAHNTLVVDGQEQNDFKTEWLFRMFAKATPEHVEFAHDQSGSRYRGRHNGYSRPDRPVEHERVFRLDAASGVLTLEDRVSGEGVFDLQWRFQCAPGLDVEHSGAQVRLRASERTWILRSHHDIAASLLSGWYSPSYGVRVAAPLVQFTSPHTDVRGRTWTFTIEPQR
jgi:uncharacterized heparinase superfamily protein